MTSQFQTRHNDDGTILESIDEQIELFEEQIGMRGKGSAQTAQEALRDHMLARGIDPDALPDVELNRNWFKEDDFGDAWEDYQNRRRALTEGGMSPAEEAGIEIEM